MLSGLATLVISLVISLVIFGLSLEYTFTVVLPWDSPLFNSPKLIAYLLCLPLSRCWKSFCILLTSKVTFSKYWSLAIGNLSPSINLLAPPKSARSLGFKLYTVGSPNSVYFISTTSVIPSGIKTFLVFQFEKLYSNTWLVYSIKVALSKYIYPPIDKLFPL